MSVYHKIQTVFLRDPADNFKQLLIGQYSEPEFEYLAKNMWEFTEKVDGTNIRIMVDGHDLTFGAKTDAASMPALLVKRLEERFHPQEDQLEQMFPGNACLYGEGYGAKIQKGGGNYRQDQDFVLFDVQVWNPEGQAWWLRRHDVEDVAQKLGLDIVPVIGKGTLAEMVEMTREGFNSIWGPFKAEGIVARPRVELQTRGGRRVITKIKHKDFHDECRAKL